MRSRPSRDLGSSLSFPNLTSLFSHTSREGPSLLRDTETWVLVHVPPERTHKHLNYLFTCPRLTYRLEENPGGLCDPWRSDYLLRPTGGNMCVDTRPVLYDSDPSRRTRSDVTCLRGSRQKSSREFHLWTDKVLQIHFTKHHIHTFPETLGPSPLREGTLKPLDPRR